MAHNVFYIHMGYLYWFSVFLRLAVGKLSSLFLVTSIYSSYFSSVLVIPDFIRSQSELCFNTQNRRFLFLALYLKISKKI